MDASLQKAGEQVLLGKKSNCLLVKDDVGKSKPTTRALPENPFVYGKPELLADRETAQDVTQKWQLHQGSKKAHHDPRDFKKLNKMSLKSGSVNARDQYKFRASHDARIPFGLVADKPVMLPGEEFTYGKRNRPQTPVNTILANQYGEEAGAMLQAQYVNQKEMQKSNTAASNAVRMTHCQIGMDAAIHDKYIERHPVPSVEQFKLQRFVKGVDPRTSTKRGDKPFMSQK